MSPSNVTPLPVPHPDPAAIMERVLLAGDLSRLTTSERTDFYLKTCQSLGLNPLTRPFDYIRLSGREVLYAKRDCADQLRKLNRISLTITDRRISGDLLVVAVRATTPDGRTDEDMGVVPVKGLAGEALSNAMLKALTKAKRRVTLSICGLGMLDESEVRSALDADALAGPVAPEPPKPEAKDGGPSARQGKPPLEVALPGGWEPARFERTGKGLREALEFLTAAVVDGAPDVVGMNNDLLDTIAEKVPALAEEVAELRAAAAEALAPKDGPEPDEPERDAFGLPPELPEDLPTDGAGLARSHPPD